MATEEKTVAWSLEAYTARAAGTHNVWILDVNLPSF